MCTGTAGFDVLLALVQCCFSGGMCAHKARQLVASSALYFCISLLRPIILRIKPQVLLIYRLHVQVLVHGQVLVRGSVFGGLWQGAVCRLRLHVHPAPKQLSRVPWLTSRERSVRGRIWPVPRLLGTSFGHPFVRLKINFVQPPYAMTPG
jgi:hypothetical protein